MQDNLNLQLAGDNKSPLERYPWCNKPIIWYNVWTSMKRDTVKHYKLNR